jgi:hypothetical protein
VKLIEAATDELLAEVLSILDACIYWMSPVIKPK